MNKPKLKFNLGKITITLFAKLSLERSGQKAEQFLNLHKKGNYGEISAEEKQCNNEIIENKANKKVLSAYTTEFNEIIWVVTDLLENTTTVLLPREYDFIFDKYVEKPISNSDKNSNDYI
ncbi:MAG: hypothetical protein JEZ01_20935 [Labilibaculum sp.]|nr:hypothetical protein [Labilibaculum sp.]MBI9060245.1 hypothetical protein [Labilibaculum sp.]